MKLCWLPYCITFLSRSTRLQTRGDRSHIVRPRPAPAHKSLDLDLKIFSNLRIRLLLRLRLLSI